MGGALGLSSNRDHPGERAPYWRCRNCGAIEAPTQIDPSDVDLPAVDCGCWKGPDWVLGYWAPVDGVS